MSEFADPSVGTGINYQELLGALLVVDVTEVVQGVNTTFGPSDPIRATVTVIDGDQAAAVYVDTLIFPKVLQSQLRSNVGKRVLGRLGQGTPKAGQSPPWTLEKATDADIRTASEFLAQQAAGRLTADDI